MTARVMVSEHEHEGSSELTSVDEYSLTVGSNYIGPAHGKQIAETTQKNKSLLTH